MGRDMEHADCYFKSIQISLYWIRYCHCVLCNDQMSVGCLFIQVIQMYTGRRVLVNGIEILGSPFRPNSRVTITKTTSRVVSKY